MNWTLIAMVLFGISLSAFAESEPGLTKPPQGYAQEIRRLRSAEPRVVAAAVESGPRALVPGPRWSEQYYVAPYYRSESLYYFAFFGIAAEFRASEEVTLSMSGEPVIARYLARRGYDLKVKSLETVDNESLLAIIDQ